MEIDHTKPFVVIIKINSFFETDITATAKPAYLKDLFIKTSTTNKTIFYFTDRTTYWENYSLFISSRDVSLIKKVTLELRQGKEVETWDLYPNTEGSRLKLGVLTEEGFTTQVNQDKTKVINSFKHRLTRWLGGWAYWQ
jgi:hypothetical protein